MRRDLVPDRKILEGEVVAIRYAHGDTVSYPLALVQVQVEGRTLEVEAAVSSTLPMSMLLGTDVPELMTLLGSGRGRSTEDAMVVTRAQAKRQQAEMVEREYQQERSGVQPHPVEGVTGHVEGEDETESVGMFFLMICF